MEATHSVKVGDKVRIRVYGVEVSAVVYRLNRSVIWVTTAAGMKRWVLPESIVSVNA